MAQHGELMVTDGADGIDGAPGADGMSVYITYHNNPTDSPTCYTNRGMALAEAGILLRRRRPIG